MADFSEESIKFQLLESTTAAVARWVKETKLQRSSHTGEVMSNRTGREAASVFERDMFITKEGIKPLMTLIGKAQKIVDDPPEGKMPPPGKVAQ